MRAKICSFAVPLITAVVILPIVAFGYDARVGNQIVNNLSDQSFTVESSEELFPAPEVLRTNIQFWKDIYAKYTDRHILLHDINDLSLVYKVIDIDNSPLSNKSKLSYRKKRRYIIQEANRLRKNIRTIAKQGGVARTEEEESIVGLLAGMSKSEMLKAASNIRFQVGLSNRFKRGVIRSGRYLPHIKSELNKLNLPEELAVIPHVESSFNPKAYSHAGAAGLWQFTRSTGRSFLKINYLVDERWDPIESSKAAAKLLRYNYDKLGSWPLAITAYNHGLGGMRRAKKRHGSDIGEIVQNYKSRIFGFASRNFYSEFLAALEVSNNWYYYFGELVLESDIDLREIKAPYYIPAKELAKNMGVKLAYLKEYNRGLRKSIWRGHLNIPKGYKIKVPAALYDKTQAAIALTPESKRDNPISKDVIHVVAKGETISEIAGMYHTSVGLLVDVNNVHLRRGRIAIIRPGQKLHIPYSDRKPVKVAKRKVRRGKAGNGEWEVASGDSLYSVALANNTTVNKLAELNDLTKRDTIYPGQILIVSEAGNSADDVTLIAAADNINKLPSSEDELESETDKSVKNYFWSLFEKNNQKDSDDQVVVADASKDSDNPVVVADASNEVINIDKSGASIATKSKVTQTNGNNSLSQNEKRLILPKDRYKVNRLRAGRGEIVIESRETLGHYAEWLEVPIASIERINKRDIRRSLRIGAVIAIPIKSDQLDDFEMKRFEYHLAELEKFLASYRVEGEKLVKLKHGQAIWDLIAADSDTPLWLVMLFNPKKDLSYLKSGDEVSIPIVNKI